MHTHTKRVRERYFVHIYILAEPKCGWKIRAHGVIVLYILYTRHQTCVCIRYDEYYIVFLVI